MSRDNNNLKQANKVKNDEFFTKYEDIHNELKHYKEQFKGKIIYCNTDTIESNFIKYLNNNKQEYQIKSIIRCNKDFRSKESIELLSKADIVITNPPFSLFREYLKQLIDYNKKFLIIGSPNAMIYKNIFPLIKDNKIRMGYSCGKSLAFGTPKGEDKKVSISWFTNLHLSKDKEIVMLKHLDKEYNKDDYPEYDNYEAINVNKLKEIPKDYFKPMGVPITYIGKHNPKLFKILWFINDWKENTAYIEKAGVKYKDIGLTKWRGVPHVNGKRLYVRVLIERKRDIINNEE